MTAVQQHHGIFPQQFRSCRNTHLGKGIVRHCRRNQIAVHSQESNHLDSSHGVVHLVTPRHMERIGETVILEHRLLQRFRKDTAVLHIGDHQLCIFLLCRLLYQADHIHGIIRGQHHRTALLDDTCLLCGDLCERVPQQSHMVEGYGSNCADQRLFHHIRGIQQAADAGFQNHQITVLFQKPEQRNGESDLKL